MENKLNRTELFRRVLAGIILRTEIYTKKVRTTINGSKIEKSQLKKENNEIFSWIAEPS